MSGNNMDKTNRVVRICRRMAEIEDIRAFGDLPVREEEDLSYEYDDLSEELRALRVANNPPTEHDK